MKFDYITTKDYLETGKRSVIHSSIREDLYTEILQVLAVTKEPLSKAIDIFIMDLLNDENKIKDFRNKMLHYRIKKK